MYMISMSMLYMYICIYVYMYICIYVYMYTDKHRSLGVYTRSTPLKS